MFDMGFGEDVEITERAERYDRSLIRRLLVFLVPYRASVVWALALAMTSTVANNLQPIFIKLAIDRGIRGRDPHQLVGRAVREQEHALQEDDLLDARKLAHRWCSRHAEFVNREVTHRAVSRTRASVAWSPRFWT